MGRVNEIDRLTKAGEPIPDSIDQWDLIFPETSFEKYKAEWDGDIDEWTKKGYPVNVYQTVSVQWLWNLIMESTYNRAEPGVLFLDRANYYNPANYMEKIFATNPCGEQTISPGGCCCLSSINLTQFVKDGNFDIEKFKYYILIAVRFLDNVNEYSDAPLPEYLFSMRNKRRVGLGVMGWGSLLFMLKIKFGSPAAAELRDIIMSTLAKESYMSSIDLAEEKGMFPLCQPDKHAEGVFISSLNLPSLYKDKLKTTGIRNSALLSIQPTGQTGIFANIVSGGLEPIFAPEYIRTVIVSSAPKEIADQTPKWFEGEWNETDLFKFDKEGDEEILKGVYNGTTYKIDKNRGLLKEVECKDYAVRYLESKGQWDPNDPSVVTSLSGLTAEDHLSDLIGFTKYLDSAASKTINLPHDCDFEQFKTIYTTAYNSGHVKGVTTYRSGTMASVLSSIETVDNGYEEVIVDSVKMPESAEATVKILRAENRKWYMTVVWNETKTRPFALFVQTNHLEKTVTTHDAVEKLLDLAENKGIPQKFIDGVKEKTLADNNARKITRVLGLLLRHGVAIKNIVNCINKVENVYVGSFLFQINKFLASFIKNGEKVDNEACAECGAETIVYQEGCKKCASCGWSKC
jgi:ribonucleoside-diphosphate reductase alpha chain